MKQLTKSFFACGLSGWCLECFWTGLQSIMHKDKHILCKTSFWMFPIYGAAALFLPVSRKIEKLNVCIRGSIYMVLIFLAEYTSGLLLKKHNACPWDYSKAKLNIKGVIRLDYAPAWFCTGLIFEKLIKKICPLS